MRLIFIFGLVLAPAVAADEGFINAVLDCKLQPSADERLACYDSVADGYSNNDVESASMDQADSDAVRSEDLFGMNPADAQRVLEQSTGRERIDRVEATIVGLTAVEPNKVAVTLDNGQIWRQTTASSLRVSEGDDVVIRRRSLGSHTLQKAGSARSMKVRRVK